MFGRSILASVILLGLYAGEARQASAEAVHFPDPALDAIVRKYIEKPEGPLQKADLAALEKITIYESEVRDLTGLEHCVNLKDLNCQSNKVENIGALAEMPQLERAWLSNNAIADVSALRGLAALTHLSLGGNPIQDIAPLAGLTALKHLSLGGLHLGDLGPLAGLTSVEELYLAKMGLTNLDFVSGMNAIRYLNASNNEIQSLEPLRGKHDLVEIELDANQISDLAPLSELTMVQRLDLTENRIARLDGFPLLARNAIVLLYGNQIADIGPLAQACGYTGEIVLELGQNRLNAEAFCKYIPELSVRGNHIFFEYTLPTEKARYFLPTKILCEATNRPDAELVLAAVNRGISTGELFDRFGIALNADQKRDRGANRAPIQPPEPEPTLAATQPEPAPAPQAPPAEPVSTDPRFPDANLERAVRKSLQAADGPLTREALEGLTDLEAYGAGISDLTGIELLPNLKKADLQQNRIQDLRPLAGLIQLENLYLTYNEISDVAPLAGLKSLKRLNLSSNKLRDIAPLAHLTTLEHLSLSANRSVEDMSVIAGLSQLNGLYIGRMGLSDLAFVSSLKNLYSLSADTNAFTSLEPLRGLEKLKDIKLDGNQLTDLSPLAGFTEVWRLNLSDNQIASIDAFPTLKSNARVELFNNQITDIRPLVQACGYTGEIVIDLGENRLAAEAFCRDIPEMEARGNRVFYKYESPVSESVPFPDIKMLCDAADRPDKELVLAAVNRGANMEELQARFGLGTPPESAPVVLASSSENAAPPTPAPAAPVIAPVSVPAAIAPTAPTAPTPADGTTAALAVTVADTQFNVSLESTGMDLQSLLGGIVLLGVGVMLVIAWRMPRSQ